jgi:hypothetical protein
MAMLTRWASMVSDTSVLPEYPRPQLTRPDWRSLNGLWQFEAAGASPWQNPPIGRDLRESIRVPFPVESYLSKIARSAKYMWYRRTMRIPRTWQGRQVHLNFGAVNWQAFVWVNGRLVGEHFGAYDSFSFDITDALREGDNELIVGVYSPLDNGGIPVGKQRITPHDIFYMASSGIWQTVWLEPTNAAHITVLETTPDVAGGKLDLVVHGAGISGQGVHVVVSEEGRAVSTADGAVESVIHVPVPHTRLWSPDEPFLYDLQVTLTGQGGGDVVGGYFGMRSLSTGLVNGVLRPLLNGEFVFQLGILDQGFWPDGLYTAPTDEALRFDLEQQKALGFNTVRKHIKVEPARWYYWADRLGLLVWQDMPSLPVELPRQQGYPPPPADRTNFERELHRIVEQLRGTTSIIQWQPFNESWRVYDRARIAALVKTLDPTRFVNPDSGGIEPDDGTGDCIDDHRYPGPDAPSDPRSPDGTRFAALGEFGAIGLVVSGHAWSGGGFTVIGCPMAANSGDLTARYADVTGRLQRLIASKGLSGSIYTEFSDVENEVDGLYTYDRVSKLDASQVLQVRQANLAVRTSVAADRTQQHIFYRGQDTAINHIWWDAPTHQLYSDQWTHHPDVPQGPGAAGDPATMVTAGQQHTFYRGADGAINHIWWDVPTPHLYTDQWTHHPDVPQGPPAAGDPATMVTTNQQHIFYRGTDGAINHIWWDVPTAHLYMDQWTHHPDVPQGPAAAGDPATMVTANQQHTFYRGADGAINHIWFDEVMNHLYMDQWTRHPDVPHAPPAAGDPATMVTPNQQHVFYRDAGGVINHIWWDEVMQHLYMDQWNRHPDVPLAPLAADDPATMVTPGQQHVFYRDAVGVINHIWWTASLNHLFFDQWTAATRAPLAAGNPATMVTS